MAEQTPTNFNPHDRLFQSFCTTTIGEDTFEGPKDGLMSASVSLGEGDRSSNCKFVVWDPQQFWIEKYLTASYEEGGLYGLGPPPASSTGALTGPIVADGGSSVADASQKPEIKAWLDTIAWCEGTSGAQGYSTQFTGTTFSGTAGHPRELKCSGSLCSDAAGRYQYLSTTWDGLGLPDFSPVNQDKGAVMLLQNRGALADAERGEAGVEAVCQKISYEWASIPPYRYAGQGTKDVGQIKDYYRQKLAAYKGSGAATPPPATPTTPSPTPKATNPTPSTTKPIEVAPPVETSDKGTKMSISFGLNPEQMIEFEFIHVGTSHSIHLNTTTFKGQCVRWALTRRSKNSAYSNITLKELGTKVASSYGLTLECPEDGPKYEYLDQSGINDYALLRRECDRVGWRLWDSGGKIIMEPRLPDENVFTLEYGVNIEAFSIDDNAQTDQGNGRSAASPNSGSSTGEAKVILDSATGDLKQLIPEVKGSTTGKDAVAQTGATVAPIQPVISASDEKKAAAGQAGEKRVKGYPAKVSAWTNDAILELNPDTPVRTANFTADFLNRVWIVDQISHNWSSGALKSDFSLYTPMAPKFNVAAAAGPIVAGQIPNTPAGKLLNPMPNTPRGTPFDPGGAIRGRPHQGIDMAGNGNQLLAVWSGTVSEISTGCSVGNMSCGSGYGNYVEIALDGEWSGWKAFYGHMASVSVSNGQKVTKGQVVGIEGDTGHSFGTHLHFELLKGGARVDPEMYFCPPPSGTYGEGAGTPLRSKC